MFQTIIIGYGPAGISAAIYLKRANKHILVIGKDLGTLGNNDEYIENYYGFSKPMLGKQLILDGIEQAKNLGVEILTSSVINIEKMEDSFNVVTENGTFQAQTVLLATGKQRMHLNVPGFTKYKGKGISLCATCDGFFYRNKRIALIGSSTYMKHELENLKPLSPHITVFTHGDVLNENLNVEVVTDPIIELVGTDVIQAIKTQNGLYEIDGVFVAVGTPTATEFAQKLGVVIEKGSIVVDESYQTNLDGLYACGDVIGGKLQIAKAVNDGMQAAFSIILHLKK